MIEFMPYCILFFTIFTTPEGHYIVDGLGVLSLLVLANAIFLQNPLPFFGKTLKKH